jgi:hypothetical protein
MMDYESAFLGLIVAGVLLMITGLGLMMPSASGLEASRTSFAERWLVEPAPLDAAPRSTDKPRIHRSDSRSGPKG